jgi:hypothetical protein
MGKYFETFYFLRISMKSTKKLTISIVFLTTLTIGCSTSKYSKEFRETKKHLDTYVIIESIVTIDARDRNSKTSDPSLSKSTARIVNRVVNETLSKKYKLKQLNGQEFGTKSLDSIYNYIDKNKIKELQGIKTTQNLKSNFLGQTDRYGLLISINGYYNPNYAPHFNLTAGMATNSIVVNPTIKPRMDIRIVVIDFEINELVYYDKFSTSNYDPRIENEVVELVRTRLRKIYYK